MIPMVLLQLTSLVQELALMLVRYAQFLNIQNI